MGASGPEAQAVQSLRAIGQRDPLWPTTYIAGRRAELGQWQLQRSRQAPTSGKCTMSGQVEELRVGEQAGCLYIYEICWMKNGKLRNAEASHREKEIGSLMDLQPIGAHGGVGYFGSFDLHI